MIVPLTRPKQEKQQEKEVDYSATLTSQTAARVRAEMAKSYSTTDIINVVSLITTSS